MSIRNNNSNKISIREMCIFAMLGALMYVSKLAMEALPNIHLLGAFIMIFTLVYRKKALIPLYIYIFIEGIFQGFSAWWVPYLYVWSILWGITMLLPKNMPKKIGFIIYPAVCSIFGLLFGTLYSPVYAILFRLNFKQTIAWIISGLSFDLMHGIGNFFAGLLIIPLSDLLKKLSVLKN